MLAMILAAGPQVMGPGTFVAIIFMGLGFLTIVWLSDTMTAGRSQRRLDKTVLEADRDFVRYHRRRMTSLGLSPRWDGSPVPRITGLVVCKGCFLSGPLVYTQPHTSRRYCQICVDAEVPAHDLQLDAAEAKYN